MIVPTILRVLLVPLAVWLFSPARAVAGEFRCADLVAPCFPPHQVSQIGAGAAEGQGDTLSICTRRPECPALPGTLIWETEPF